VNETGGTSGAAGFASIVEAPSDFSSVSALGFVVETGKWVTLGSGWVPVAFSSELLGRDMIERINHVVGLATLEFEKRAKRECDV